MGRVLLRFKVFKVHQIFTIRNFNTKLSYFHSLGEEPLKALTLGQLAEISSCKYGDKLAVISCHQNRRLTFRELLDEADRLAAGFVRLGFQKGDKIGLWAPNLAEWYVAYLACARAGFVTVTMNPFYQSKEITYLVKKVSMKGIICGGVFRKQNFYNILTEACPEIALSKPGKIYSVSVPSLRNIVVISNDDNKGTYKYSDILNLADQDTIAQVKHSQYKIDIDDPCNIQFTSGTSGNPKAPVQSHFSIVNNGYYCGIGTEMHKKHYKICLQNPLFHAFGTVVTLSASLNHGNTVVLPSAGYDPDKNLNAIAQEQCTAIFGTPTMYVDLINLQRKRNENINVEIALSGGSLCPPTLFKNMLEILKVKKVKSVYGLTETTASICFSTENDNELQATSTVGKVLPHLEVKVVNDEGTLVPIGVPGELCVRGPNIMSGYFEDEDKTKEIMENGWLHTGDQFVLNEDGYGQVVGRLKDMIIRGGENIYPKEIEEYLITHPDILEVQVVGLPHERLGEEVCACLKTKEGRNLTLEEIHQFCKGHISKFKIPTVMKIVDKFPTTPSGKIQKYKIVEMILKNK